MLIRLTERFQRWFSGPPPHSVEEELALQSIPIVEAYRCQDCRHIVFRAPVGVCRKCGSSAIHSITGELHRLRQQLQLFINGMKDARETIDILKQRNRSLRDEKQGLAEQLRGQNSLVPRPVAHANKIRHLPVR